jgi:hypothetical protein
MGSLQQMEQILRSSTVKNDVLFATACTNIVCDHFLSNFLVAYITYNYFTSVYRTINEN